MEEHAQRSNFTFTIRVTEFKGRGETSNAETVGCLYRYLSATDR